MHRIVKGNFDNIEEALQFHSDRPASVLKIPVMWHVLAEDPAATNRAVNKKLSVRGLSPDGTLLGEIRRSILLLNGLEPRKNSRRDLEAPKPAKIKAKTKARKAKKVKRGVDSPGDSSPHAPPALQSEIGPLAGELVKAMKSHGLKELNINDRGEVLGSYVTQLVSVKIK